MLFKIFYNDKERKLDINCINDSWGEIILPGTMEEHVHFPIPNDLQNDIKSFLMPYMGEEEEIETIEALRKEIEELHLKHREYIDKLREKYNQVIIEKCEEFRFENSELFI